jgi:hypothetical protein
VRDVEEQAVRDGLGLGFVAVEAPHHVVKNSTDIEAARTGA